MQQEWRRALHTGHRVLDRNGKNIGIVKNVQEQARAAGGQQSGGGDYVEVECNLPNLRKTLYIPFDSFRDCTDNACSLNLTEDELLNKSWDQRPTNL